MRPATSASEALDRALVVAPLTVAPDASVAAAVAMMAAAAAAPHALAAARASCVLVLAADRPPALLSERDVVGLIAAGVRLDTTPIEAVATPVPCAPQAALSSSAAALALLGDAAQLVVLDATGGVAGLITRASLLEAVASEAERCASERDETRAYAQSLLNILEAMRDIVASASSDGQIVFLNTAGRAMLGIPPDEDLSPTRIADYHPPEVAAHILQEALPHAAAMGFWEGESCFRRRDGSLFPTAQIIVAHRQPDGAISHYSTIASDISARQQAERELRESEERLRLALSGANQGLYDLDLQTGKAIVTPEYATMLGYDYATFDETNQKWLERLHPDDAERVGATYLAYVAGVIPSYAVEHRQRTADGGWKWILSLGKIVARDAAGNPLRMLGTHTDITARKEAELALLELNQELEMRVAERTAALQASQERLTLAMRSAAMGIWDWDIVNNTLTWDQRMYELYGLTPEAFARTYVGWANGLHPEDRAAAEEAIALALSGEREFDTEFRVCHPDGTMRVLKANGLVQRSPSGEPVRMIGINYDVTERRRSKDRLHATSQQLAAANRELEAFAYSVSHDLRAPLRAIDGFSQALVEDYEHLLDAEARGYLTRIRGGVQRMSQLIDDLLALSRVTRFELTRARVDLSALVARIVAELRESDPQREVEVVIAAEVKVWGDASMLRVVLDNLLANAWKFTSHHRQARIEFGVTSVDGQPAYFVRDDGAGYDPAYANKLFGVFQRLHDAHEFPGTGIGLATVQRVIHRHGGQVWSEGAVEQGATFYFTLPGEALREERHHG